MPTGIFLCGAHNKGMRSSVAVCLFILIVSAVFGGIYAFSGFNALYFVCFSSEAVYRSFLAVNFAAALFMLYAAFSKILRSYLR